MNVEQLEWFCRAYEARSFAQAARRAFVSRQALGKAMKSLENELGCLLFHRHESGIEPTAAADDIYPLAVRCTTDCHTIRQLCHEASREPLPSVRMGLADGMVSTLGEEFFNQLESQVETVQISVEKHFYVRCLDLLHAGEIDFAICPGPLQEAGLSRIRLADLPLYVAVHRDLVSFDVENCTLADLQGFTFFVVGNAPLNDLGLGDLMKKHGMSLRCDTSCNDYEMNVLKVRARRGAVLVPENELHQVAGGELAVFPVPDPGLRWVVEFLWPTARNLSPAEQDVVSFMQANAI
jgi:DNA-binding transcriptional LysR family regulator